MAARFTRMRRKPTVEEDAIKGASAVLDLSDRDLGERWGLGKKSARLLQPSAIPIELQSSGHFLADALEHSMIADRTSCLEAQQDDFVSKGLRR
ncbi:Uncharacterised protein [Mycobacterium tuberculosis]|nr:Uncharacterised protein [Mycobacterium tuberculosis]COW81084.1 Uncharacterised protein [Mycobacterium tuberculosis]COW94842.1 Uncharacterised protein [Mycobacterium tuberculosis]